MMPTLAPHLADLRRVPARLSHQGYVNEEDPLGHTLDTGGRDAAKFRRYHPGYS